MLKRSGRLLAILLGVCTLQAQTPTSKDLLGLSPPQVLRLGRKAWYDKYTGQIGESTAGMAQAETLYGQCLASETDKKVPANRKKTFLDVRKELNRFAEACIGVASAYSGGGTMWIPVRAGASADAEEALAYLVGPSGNPPKPAKVSDVTKILDQAATSVRKNASSIDSYAATSGTDAVGAFKVLKEARTSFAQIVGLAGNLPRSSSDRLLGFCRIYAETAAKPGTS